MLPTLPFPELFFGLVSPVGTDNTRITRLISDALARYTYQLETFKVTQLMKALTLDGRDLKDKRIDLRYESYINYANELRRLSGWPYILSMLCCGAVRSFRRNSKTDDHHQAYLFDQFKRTEEVAFLRQVYGRQFIVVSIYSEKKQRIERLTHRIASDYLHTRPDETHRATARLLVERDEKEADPSGQRLQDTFATADLFINIDDPDSATRLIERFLAGLFGSNTISPTRDEYGVYLAKTSALRSLDLSRQVGAAIMTRDGEILTLGCNEVPKGLGGTYWTGDAGDARDYRKEADPNDEIKRSLLVDFAHELQKHGYMRKDLTAEQLTDIVVTETTKPGKLKDVQLMDLLEFGRIIHAEMSALCDAARLGRSVKDATLFCTTFPCHICAKHIVASGIKRVVFIEPYPKSYAEQLHSDAISVGEDLPDKVIFDAFIGISPYRYRDIFERGKRKNDTGKFLDWIDGRKPQPNIRMTVAPHVANEAAVLKLLQEKVKELSSAGSLAVAQDWDAST